MAYLNLVNFDTGDLSELLASSGAGISASSTSPIDGSHSLRVVATGATSAAQFGAQADGANSEINSANVYFHTRMRWDAWPATAINVMPIYGVISGGTKLLAVLNISAAGALSMVYLNASDTAVGLGSGPTLALGTDYSVEIAVLNSATAAGAQIILRVDGQEYINASGLTLSSAVGNVGQFAAGIYGTTATGEVRLDSIAIRDDGWCGPLKVTTLLPTGAGNYSDWAAGTGSTFAEVDDATSDGDTTYLKSATSGQKSSFAAADLSGSPAVKAAKVLAFARDEGGASGFAPMFRAGGTDAIGTYGDPGATYVGRGYTRATDPSGSAWTAASVNAAEVGVALNASAAVRVTRLALLVAEEVLIAKADAENAAANVTEAEALVFALDDAENAAANVTEAEVVDAVGAVDAENLGANVTEADAIAATADDADSAAANVTEAEAMALTIDDADSAAANVTEAETVAVTGDFPPQRIRIDVYTAAGAKLDAGPITDVLALEYGLELDRIGAFSCDLPATSRQADSIAQGYELRFHREGEGLVFRGIVERVRDVVDEGGRLVRRVSGPSIARQLARLSTLLGRAYSGVTLAAAVGDNATAGSLLHGTGWAPGTLAAPATTLLARFDGPSRWEALEKVAEIFRVHVREDNLAAEIDMVAAGTASGLVFQNVEVLTPELAANDGLVPIASIEVESESEDLVTTVIPLGAGEGLNVLDLRHSNRSSPYAISSATGPDGRTYYYLEDAAAVSAYGRRERVLSVKDAIPLANSAAGFQAAANALYDVAATFLERAAAPLESYQVAVTGLRHLDATGAPRFELGETVRVVYRGIVEDETGARAWRSIDADLYVMAFRRRFDASGADAWQITVNSLDRYQDDPANRIAEAFQAMHALQVSLRNYTYHEVHILQRTTVESGKPATLTVKWDGNVSLVHQAKLTFKVSALRSNVSVAASGGAATSSSGGAQTSSSGGATTSSSGTSHTHSVSGQAANAAGAHAHKFLHDTGNDVVSLTGTGGWVGPQPASTQAQSSSHTHTETGGTTGLDSVNHTHSMNAHEHYQVALRQYQAASGQTIWLPYYGGAAGHLTTYETATDHTHTVTATTSGAEGSHTHTVGSHTHTVTDHTHTVGNHTHALTYGIYEASSPSSPSINITINGTNRTLALGGAWNTVGSEVTVDITAYLQNGATELPLQQSNTIVISGSVLADVEAVLRSRVTASSLVPV